MHGIGNGVKAMLEHGIDPREAFASDRVAPRLSRSWCASTRRCISSRDTRWRMWSIAGVTLKTGNKIGLLLGAANRDPARFPDPDAFDAARDPNPHVAFGARHPFLRRGAARAARDGDRCADPVRPLAGAEARRNAGYRDAYHFHGLEKLKLVWR